VQAIKATPYGKGQSRTGTLPRDLVPQSPAAAAVLEYYESVNVRDKARALAVVSESCLYEDLTLFSDGKAGREAFSIVLDAWNKFPEDLLIMIDEVTPADPTCVGVTWHVELDGGIELPFSRGVSFYRVDEMGLITYARDIAEPTTKPGEGAVGVLKVIIQVMRATGYGKSKAGAAGAGEVIETESRATGSKEAWALGALYVVYWGVVMLSTAVPGVPIYQTEWSTIQEVLDESLNFFYINPLVHALGLPNPLPNPACDPISEALFNVVNAWSLMFLPLLLNDTRAGLGKVPVTKWWFGQFFLTNIFFIPAMSQRAQVPKNDEVLAATPPPRGVALGAFGSAIGATGFAVFAASLWWFFGARPELVPAELGARIADFQRQFAGDRVFFAFVLDMAIYSVFQWELLGAALAPGDDKRWARYVPYFGLAYFLASGGRPEAAADGTEAA